MKSRYKILWIDDKISSLEEVKSRLDDFNENVGIQTEHVNLKVKINRGEGEDDFKTRIEKELKEKFEEPNSFNLILIDLNMQNKGGRIKEPIDGGYFIDWIRNDHTMYRPIVFYSTGNFKTNKQAKELLKKIFNDPEILGSNLMICQRDRLPDFLEELVEDMHEEEHKVNNVRGFLMDSVSEIDALIIEAIKTLDSKVEVKERKKLANSIKDKIKSRQKDVNKFTNNITGKKDNEIIECLLEDIRKTDLHTRARILSNMLSQLNKIEEEEKLKSFYEENKQGGGSLLSIRNYYAHKRADELEEEQDIEKCKRIRNESRDHIENLEKIKKLKPE